MELNEQSLTPGDWIEAYRQDIELLGNAVAGMSLEQLRARPIPGKWSTLEVVSHIADSEVFFTDRIERTLAMERPLLISVDERPYPERLNYQSFDLGEQLDLFAALRRHAGRILRMQPPDAWERTAVHSEIGLVTVRQLVAKAVRHTRHHIQFIAEKRVALTVSPRRDDIS